MPLPDLDRALLCTYTIDDYHRFMSPKGEKHSLLDELSKHLSEISLSQEIPGSAFYPPLKVVDVTPATVCALNDSATLVIIPPESFSTLKEKAWCFTNNEEEETVKPLDAAIHASNNHAADFRLADMPPQKYPVFQSTVRVEISPGCKGSFAIGNQLLFDQLFLQNDNVIYIECDTHKSGFSVCLTNDKEQNNIPISLLTPHLIVSQTVFQNIRQVAAYRAAFRPEISISFHTSFFEIPLDWFAVLEDMRGECLSSSQLPTAASVAVAPLFENFVLESLYGDGYLGLITRYLQTAGSQFLNNLIISEGDILAIPFSPLSEGQNNNVSLSDVQVVNSELSTIIHKLRHWDGIRESEKDPWRLSFLLTRVAKVLPESDNGLAVFASSGKKTSILNLAPQSLFMCPTYLAPAFTPQEGSFCDVEFKKKVRECFETCLYSKKYRKVSFFVAQGLPENFCCETIEDTAKEYGLSTCILTLEGLQQKDLVYFLNELKKDTKVPLVVLIRGSDSGEMGSDNIFSFLNFFSQEENVPCPPVPIFYVSESIETISPSLIARSFNSEGTIVCASSTEKNRKRLLDYTLKKMCRTFGVLPSLTLSLDNLASWTTGLSVADLIAFAADCVNDACSAEKLPPHSKPVLSEPRCEQVLQQYLNSHGHNLVSTKLQPVRWSDVGGLYEAKKELQEAIQLPLSHPELFANGMKRRSGILFYGPPGCGKTLLAKAVATEMNMNFISVKGPELINQYVGESERNIRLLFQRARDSSPCIVFFDELDALAPARGSKGDGGGAMDRVVSQLLVEVDGVGQKKSDGTEGEQIIIIGATNRPDLLDPSLLRPGRFDRLCYLGIPSTKEEQLFAVRALTRKFTLDSDVSLEAVIEPLECIYTGADFFALCSDAMMYAVQENIAKLTSQIALGGEKESVGTVNLFPEKTEVIPEMKVKMDHFSQARNNLKPSVAKEDLTRYETLKTKFSA